MNIFELFANSTTVNNSEYFDGLMRYLFSAQAILTLIACMSFAVGVIFYIRWWIAQSDISRISQDLREIKEYLIKNSATENPPVIMEEVASYKETKLAPKIKSQIQFKKILNKRLPKWLLIVLLSTGLVFILAILYMNFFV